MSRRNQDYDDEDDDDVELDELEHGNKGSRNRAGRDDYADSDDDVQPTGGGGGYSKNKGGHDNRNQPPPRDQFRNNRANRDDPRESYNNNDNNYSLKGGYRYEDHIDYGAKVAYFHKEGDQYASPYRVIITRARYQNMELLLGDLNRKLHLPRGVRAIFTSKGRHPIDHIDDFENESHYICSSNVNRPIETDIDHLQDKPPTWHGTRQNKDRHQSNDRFLYYSYRDPDSLPSKRARKDSYGDQRSRSRERLPDVARKGNNRKGNSDPSRERDGNTTRRSDPPGGSKGFLPRIERNHSDHEKNGYSRQYEKNKQERPAAERRNAWDAPPPHQPRRATSPSQRPNNNANNPYVAKRAGSGNGLKRLQGGPLNNSDPYGDPKKSKAPLQDSKNRANNNNASNSHGWPTGLGYRGDDYVIPPSMYQNPNGNDPKLQQNPKGGRSKGRGDYGNRNGLSWTIRLFSGEMPNGASSSDVMLTMYGQSGVSPTLTLQPKRKAFVSSTTEVYPAVRLQNSIGEIYKIRIEISNTGSNPDWLCEKVELEDDTSGEVLNFPCRRWLSSTLGDRHIVREIPALTHNRPPVALVHYELTVQTGNLYNAGSNGKVYVTLYGERGDSGVRMLKNPLNHSKVAPFTKGSADVFLVESVSLGELRRLRVQHEPESHNLGWYLENIIVREKDLHATFVFPAGRWINSRDEDRQLTVELKATDLFNYNRLQEKQMWPLERWKYMMEGAELVFFSTVSQKPLRITSGGFVDARAEPVDRQDGHAAFIAQDSEDNDNEQVVAFYTSAQTPAYLAFSQQKIVSKPNYTAGCDIRLHTLGNGCVCLESDKYPSNFVSVATNGQMYPETQVHSQPGANQAFFCYVKGCFRDGGIVMLCSSKSQTLCIDRDPNAVVGTGGKNRLAHFRVHKIASGNVRMFESMIFPGHYLQIKKGTCNCMGTGDRFCEFKVRRCREQNYVTLESLRDRGFIFIAPNGHIQVATDVLPSNPGCRLTPEVIEFGQRKVDQGGGRNKPGNKSRDESSIEKDDPDSDLNSDVDDLYRDRYRGGAKPKKKLAPKKERDERFAQLEGDARRAGPPLRRTGPTRDQAPPAPTGGAAKKGPPPPKNGLRPTVFPFGGFNPKDDCNLIQKSIPKSDIESVIKVITRRTTDQRLSIARSYKDVFRKDIVTDVKALTNSEELSELLGNLFLPHATLVAEELKKAMHKEPPDEIGLIDLICPHSNDDLHQIKTEYQKRFGKSLDSSLAETVNTFLQHLIGRLLAKPMPSTTVVKPAMENDAKVLHQHFDKHTERGEDHFLFTLLTGRSNLELQTIFESYKQSFSVDVEKEINDKIKGENAKYFSAVARCLTKTQAYFAGRINDLLSHDQKDNSHPGVHRLILTRCEIDTENIKEEYQKAAGSPLSKGLEKEFQDPNHLATLLYLLKAKEVEPEKNKAPPKEPIRRNLRDPDKNAKGAAGDKKQKESNKDKQGPGKEKDAPQKFQPYPTVIAEPKFDVAADCEKLMRAMKGLGTDENALIGVLTKRSWQQRQEIKKKYEELYKEDLEGEIRGETKGNFGRTLLALLKTPVDYLAFELKDAMKGPGTDEVTLIEILCTVTYDEMQQIKAKYKELFDESLADDIKKDTNGAFETLLVGLVNRPKSPEKVDGKAAREECKAMHEIINQDGEKGADELTKLVSSRGHAQLRLIFENYNIDFKTEIEDDIKKHFKSDVQKAFLAVVGSIRNKQVYYATRFNAAMEGAGTEDENLIRLVVSRCEIDLGNIKQEFEELYKKTLVSTVQGEANGDYENALVSLINGNNPAKPPPKKKPEPEKGKEKEKPASKDKGKASKDTKGKGPAKDQNKKDDAGKEAKKDDKMVFIPTVVAESKFDAKADCEKLKKAFKGLGTDEDSLNSILTKRSWQQRADLEKTYKEMFKEELEAQIDSETDGNYHEVLWALMKTPIELSARLLNKAMKGAGTDEDTLIEIICSKSNDDLQLIKTKYKELYKVSLEDEIKGETAGALQQLLVALLNRPKSPVNIDAKAAKADSKTAHDAILKGSEKGAEEFTNLLASRGQAQLRMMFDNYKTEFKADIADDIKKHFKGDLESAYLAVVEAVRNKPVYFAQRFNAAMEGAGTKGDHLVRLVVTRCEVDLGNIKQEYEKLYKKALVSVVDGETTGDYEHALISLINGNNTVKVKQDDKIKDKSKEKEKAKVDLIPTVVAESKFDVKADCEKLANAMKGIGTDEDALTAVLTKRSWQQRRDIETSYKEIYKKELEAELSSENSGDYLKVLLALLKTPIELAARVLNSAMKGAGTDEDTLIEIICTKSNADLQQIKEKYNELFKKSLEEDIKGDTGGTFQQLLVALINRPKSPENIDVEAAKADSEALHDAIEKGEDKGSEEMTKLFSSRGQAQLRVVFENYKTDYKADIDEDIKKHFKGDIQKAYLAVVDAIRNKHEYFARRLNAAMEGVGTKGANLIRLVVSRCEIDLGNIKEDFQRLYQKSLVSVVTDETGGDFQKALISLINGNNNSVKPAVAKAVAKEEGKDPIAKQPTKVDLVPTVIAESKFDVKADCEKLMKAMKGIGTDEDALTAVLTKRSWQQRRDIETSYKEIYKKDLEAELTSENSGDYLKVLLDLLKTPIELAARDLKAAMKGAGTDEDTLIEIICTKSNTDLQQIKEKYKELFKKSLEEDIKGDTGGTFQQILVALINRPKSPENVDVKAAKADSEVLHEAIVKDGDKGAEEMTKLLAKRGQAQLRMVFENYKANYNVDIDEDIKKHFKGDTQKAYLAVVDAIRNKHEYFARRLNAAMEGVGTKGANLIRLIVSRCEIDIGNIKEDFQRLYKKSLVTVVTDETGGDFQKALISLINGNNTSVKPAVAKAATTEEGKDQKTTPADKKSKESVNAQHTEKPTTIPTVVAEPKFDVKADCEKLMKAMKGIGTDEDSLIAVLTKRSWEQRTEIEVKYKEIYKKDLEAEIKSETDGEFFKILASLLKTPIELAARDLNAAMKGAGTDEDTLIEIVCTKSNEDLQKAKQKYKELFKNSLEEDIKKDTGGAFQELLVALINRPKSPSSLDAKACRADANTMHQALAKGGPNAPSELTKLFSTRGQAQLRLSFENYKTEYEHDIDEDIKKTFSSDIETAYLAVVNAIRNKPLYFARRLNATMEGAGTKDEHLSRIVVSRCEVDLGNIKAEFEKEFKKPLMKAVESETSGDFKKTLVSLINGNNTKGQPPAKEAEKKEQPKEKEKTVVKDKEKTVVKEKEKTVVKEKEKTVVKETKEEAKPSATLIPTLIAEPKFDVKADCEKLQKSMKGIGTDEDLLTAVLSKRSWQQRAEIEKNYMTLYKKNLEDDIKNETDGSYYKVLSSLLKTPTEFAARELNEAVSGGGTDEDILIEILCTISHDDLQQVKAKYKEFFKKSLEQDVKDDTTGTFQQLLVALINRPKSPSNLDAKSAKDDGKTLNEAITKGGDEGANAMTKLLSSRGQAQLRMVFETYRADFKKDIEAEIIKSFHSDVQKAYLAVVDAIKNKPLYFAKRLNAAMDGTGTNDSHLIRLVVSRCEIDLENIKTEYQKLYKNTLVKAVESETSGDYQKVLISLVNGNNPDKKPAPDRKAGASTAASTSKPAEDKKNEKAEDKKAAEKKEEKPAKKNDDEGDQADDDSATENLMFTEDEDEYEKGHREGSETEPIKREERQKTKVEKD